jgi:nucleoside phosphorylase
MDRLSPESLRWALTHILEFGDTDLFPPLFEFGVIRSNWPELLEFLQSIDLTSYNWRQSRRWLIPKDQLSFRAAVQLDPFDSILFTAMVRDFARVIERKRHSSVFSYRVGITKAGRLYLPRTRAGFWSASRTLIEEYPFAAVLDISDFYNQIEHDVIAAQLAETGVSEVRIAALRKLLESCSQISSRGIPIGPQPSHLLAEASLIPLDGFLASQYEFARYADDIHVFCESYQAAQTAVFKVADFLDRFQRLSLNRQKTKVLTASEFEEATSRMLVDDPINRAEEEMLEVIRKRLTEEGMDDNLYTGIEITHLAKEDLVRFSPPLVEQVLSAYVGSDSAHYIRLRWFLRRLTQVGVPGGVDFVANNVERFAPAIVDAVRYLASASKSFSGSWSTLGGHLLRALNHELLRANEYLQTVVLGAFANVKDLNHAGRLIELFPGSGPAVRREIVLATAAQNKADWLRQHQGELPSMDPWLRRAVYFAMRRLPELERLKLAPKSEETIDDMMTARLLAASTVRSGPAVRGRFAKDIKPSFALITALPLELAAMRALLINPRRLTVDRKGAMRECYVGQVPARDGGYHRLVLALSGLGNNSAAARAMAVVLDFPSVQCLFMVGIAGGCPNPSVPGDHVRLGDIVVSGEHGILQYDFVKQTASDTKRRFLPRPPSASVLEAVQFLRSEELSATPRLKRLINQASKKLQVRRPAAKLDVLESGEHPKDYLRVGGQPRIFVAPIGSANILLKDAKTRDMLRDKYGVRAIEMEGSGIADASWELEIGYIVIRGICDYCDMNKSDIWQPCAAIVASAYARLLLESMARTGA